MPNVVTTTGFSSLQRKLERIALEAKADGGLTVEVGYTAPHAVYVHEDMEAQHPNGGKAKYLEAPSRLYAREIQKVIADVLARTNNMEEALLSGGEFLLDRSAELVPVDTGELLNSGFVMVTGGGGVK